MSLKSINSNSFNLKILSGCTSFCFYPNLNGKRILLLGEVHTNEFLCNKNKNENDVQEVHKYISELINNSDQCIDLFIEGNYGNKYTSSQKFIDSNISNNNKDLNQYESGLYAVFDKMNYKTSLNKKHRIHNADPRFLYETVNNKHIKDIFHVNDSFKSSILNFFSRLFDFNSKLNLNKFLDDEIKINIIKYLLNLNDDFETFYEIYNVFNKNISKAELKEYMDLYFKTVKKELNKCSPEMKHKIQNLLFEVYYEWEDLNFYFLLVDSVMDLYILSRLFMTFDKHKMNRGPSNCRDLKYSTVNNAIIYTGTAHTEHYTKFFYKLYNIIPNIYINNIFDSDSDSDSDNANYKHISSQLSCIKFKKPFNYFTSIFKQYENEMK